MRLYLVIGNNVDLKNFSFDGDIFAIDKGAKLLAKAGISFRKAIGDFDSIDKSFYNKMLLANVDLIKLNPIKNDTDTYHALSLYYNDYDEIYIVGGMQGKRIEHFLANLTLFKEFPKIKFIDDYSFISLVKPHEVLQKDCYTYYSFFALEDVKSLSLEGFKYQLKDYHLKQFDSLCISNEITGDFAYVTFESGSLLLIKSREDN